jgi:hypothetical protein
MNQEPNNPVPLERRLIRCLARGLNPEALMAEMGMAEEELLIWMAGEQVCKLIEQFQKLDDLCTRLAVSRERREAMDRLRSMMTGETQPHETLRRVCAEFMRFKVASAAGRAVKKSQEDDDVPRGPDGMPLSPYPTVEQLRDWTANGPPELSGDPMPGYEDDHLWPSPPAPGPPTNTVPRVARPPVHAASQANTRADPVPLVASHQWHGDRAPGSSMEDPWRITYG